MKQTKSSGIFRPFEGLRILLKDRSLPPNPITRDSSRIKQKAEADPVDDKELFKKAMVGVKPISKDKYRKKIAASGRQLVHNKQKVECDTLIRLHNLIEHGEGFVVADTSEYAEGVGYAVNPAVTKYLHRGEFSIQAYVDLHGLSVQAAEEVFNRFLKEMLMSGKRAVSIIHGRGLSSPDKPVLKTKVHKWLTTGPWCKWVLAFSSARPCDGGAGATYVLLRQRPLTKRLRKRL
ncbi:MAG: Smr/MutS family protein [Deltaproteobacteria bacterium]|nr:MAG: Smr/MutS family protein [Deltaproteobacteria bacterium]